MPAKNVGLPRQRILHIAFAILKSGKPLDPNFALACAQCYFIEHSFREAKSECGLADYQVRRGDAWHHHIALVMLGTLFLLKQKVEGRQQWPMLSCNDLVTALAHLLPRRQLIAEELAANHHPASSSAPAGQGIPRRTVNDGIGMNLTK